VDVQVSDLLGVDLVKRLEGQGALAKGGWEGVLPRRVIGGVQYEDTPAAFHEVRRDAGKSHRMRMMAQMVK
jgi:hypothetical protein